MQRYVIHRLITSNKEKLKFLPQLLKLAGNWTIRFSTTNKIVPVIAVKGGFRQSVGLSELCHETVFGT